VLFQGIVYPSVEHAYQAAKTNNWSERAWIIAAPTPAKAKRIGRSVTLRPDWDNIKVDIMYQILKSKFWLPKLKKQLLATNSATLIEGNTWHDNFWGNCVCAKCKDVEGKNVLGTLLMQLRRESSQ